MCKGYNQGMDIARPQPKRPIPDHAKKVFAGKIFEIYQWKQVNFDGSISIIEKAKRTTDSIDVLPITSEGKIILTLQEQPGMEPFIGALGGRIDPGETPLDCAKRELLEESGYAAERFELLHSENPNEKVDWANYVFLAKGLSKTQDVALEPGEKIQLVEYKFDEYMQAITKPNFHDQPTALFSLCAEKEPQTFSRIRAMFQS